MSNRYPNKFLLLERAVHSSFLPFILTTVQSVHSVSGLTPRASSAVAQTDMVTITETHEETVP
jgi:hypothetical protein